MLVKTFSHLAVVAVGQSIDSSTRGHLMRDSQTTAGFLLSSISEHSLLYS